MLWLGVRSLGSDESLWLSLGTLGFGLILLEGSVNRIATKLEFTENELIFRTWRRKRIIKWERIVEVNAIPTSFGEPNLLVKDDTESVVLLTSHFANSERLNRTIIERTYLNNPNIKINKITLYLYGKPPYGIFTDKKRESQPKSGQVS